MYRDSERERERAIISTVELVNLSLLISCETQQLSHLPWQRQWQQQQLCLRHRRSPCQAKWRLFQPHSSRLQLHPVMLPAVPVCVCVSAEGQSVDSWNQKLLLRFSFLPLPSLSRSDVFRIHAQSREPEERVAQVGKRRKKRRENNKYSYCSSQMENFISLHYDLTLSKYFYVRYLTDSIGIEGVIHAKRQQETVFCLIYCTICYFISARENECPSK